MNLFISYAAEDRGKADELAVRLRADGHQVFLDQDDLAHGDDYDARIRVAIAGCDLYLFLVSPHSVEGGRYVLSELEFARDRFPNPRGRVLPVMIAETPFARLDPYLKAVTVLQPKGNWIAETLASVSAMGVAQRRRRLMVIAGPAGGVALLVIVAVLMRDAHWDWVDGGHCQILVELLSPAESSGLALDIANGAGVSAYRLSGQPLAIDLGPAPGERSQWTLLLRGHDGNPIGEQALASCPSAPATLDFGAGHVLRMSPQS